jgi:hypothetical protein
MFRLLVAQLVSMRQLGFLPVGFESLRVVASPHFTQLSPHKPSLASFDETGTSCPSDDADAEDEAMNDERGSDTE